MGLPTQSTQKLGKAGRVSPLSSTGYLILVPKPGNCGGIERGLTGLELGQDEFFGPIEGLGDAFLIGRRTTSLSEGGITPTRGRAQHR